MKSLYTITFKLSVFIVLSICSIATTIQTNAQTILGGVISSNTTWTQANSPFVVTNNLLIQQNVKVIVEPGVTIKFNIGIFMQIDGELQAIGTGTDSIFFTRNGGTNLDFWGGLYFSPLCKDFNTTTGNGCILEYCAIGNAYDVFRNGMISMENSSIKISHCSIRNAGAGGIDINGVTCSPIITDNKIYDVAFPIIETMIWSNWAVIERNEIFNIPNSFDNPAMTLANVIFNDNYIHHDQSELTIRIADSVVMTGNTFQYGNVGLLIAGGNSHVIKCNTFTNYKTNLVIMCERHSVISNNNFMSYLDWNVFWAGWDWEGYSPFDCTLPSGSGTYTTLDLSSNYWGGISNTQMDGSIWDFADDFTLKGLVNYTPALNDTAIFTPADCSYLPVGIIKLESSNIFNAFPNPFHDFTRIDFSALAGYENLHLNVYNVFGELVKDISASGQEIIFTRDNLANGIYFCQISSTGKIVGSKKLIIQ